MINRYNFNVLGDYFMYKNLRDTETQIMKENEHVSKFYAYILSQCNVLHNKWELKFKYTLYYILVLGMANRNKDKLAYSHKSL